MIKEQKIIVKHDQFSVIKFIDIFKLLRFKF